MRSLKAKRLDEFTEEDMTEILRLQKIMLEKPASEKYAFLSIPYVRDWIVTTGSKYSDKAFAKAFTDSHKLR